MMILPYPLVLVLIFTGYFMPVLLLVFLALPTFRKLYPALLKPKPAQCPPDFPQGQGGWPLYFAPIAFVNNRAFGKYFVLGLILDILVRLVWKAL